MSIKDLYHNKWVRFSFWALLYTLWVIWLGNFWWLLGLIVVFDLHITKRVKWAFWKKRYKEGEKRNTLLDWLDALIFAVIVVTFINMFFFQAFKIPSSSMENSLMTGDFLFVNKVKYGPKVPQTPLTVPFTHNVMPGGLKKSYSTLIQNDYKRMWGYSELKRDDYVVFNFPHGDTVLAKRPQEDYHTYVRSFGREYAQEVYGPIIVRPTDKKDHYVKRCVAVAGDTLSIVSGKVIVNGVQQPDYKGIRNTYTVVTDGSQINVKFLEDLQINLAELYFDITLPGYPAMPLTNEGVKKLEELKVVKEVAINIDEYSDSPQHSLLEIFPFNQNYPWTRDNYGPLWIPEKGSTVELTEANLPLYQRIITAYEGNELKVENGKIYINSQETTTYTFKQDYYFMMGDNRHNSLDSRYWGFVPEDHIVGAPAVIWLSVDANKSFPKNIRWNRILKFL